MATHPIDLRETDQIENNNIVNMQPSSCITINIIPPGDICLWIISKGGWNAITAYDIMTLADAYIGQGDLGFPVTMSYIGGVISYYLKRRTSGNLFTDCTFQV